MRYSKDINVTVNIDIEDIARFFARSDASDQALFFNHVAEIVEDWDDGISSFAFQMQAVIDHENLKPEGKEIMTVIREYGEAES